MSCVLEKIFNLDPTVHFLNHGSFGACPIPVFAAYQAWQAELERQPVEFLGRRATDLLAESRAVLAQFLGVNRDDVVYFPNPTTAGNMVARSTINPRSQLRLTAGDEILTTDHEYGSLDRTWSYVCAQSGAAYVRRSVPLPCPPSDAFIEHFWAGVNERTRLIFISHITSPTALIFPVAEICHRAREAGILTMVDGAHAPGQISLNLDEIGADIYIGACHKWLCAPKGAAFLYARQELQPWLEPLVISWGWQSDEPGPALFVDWHEWQGTRDLSAFLAVPVAIRFQAEHDWTTVRERCHRLGVETRNRIIDLTDLPPVCDETGFGQMFAARLPACDLEALKIRLYEEHRVEVPVVRWSGEHFIRVSFQAYNDRRDAEALLAGLAALLPEVTYALAG